MTHNSSESYPVFLAEQVSIGNICVCPFGMRSVDFGRSAAIRKKLKQTDFSDSPLSQNLNLSSSMPRTAESHMQDSCAPFPVEEIVQYPPPGYVAPSFVAFSRDDKLISYLFSPDSTLSRKIFLLDPTTQCQQMVVSPPGSGVDECNLSVAEKLRRERLRERGLGITRYDWAGGADESPFLVVPLPGGIYIQNALGPQLTLKACSSPSCPILDPVVSPDGFSIAYVQEDELYVTPLRTGEPKQITYGARGTGKTHGLAEYIAQEEMERRHGFWWSPDSKFIAFAEVDASVVPPYRIMHPGKASLGGDAQEDHAYPFAGNANVKVRLGVVPSGGGDVVWTDLHCGNGNEGDNEEEYLARVSWMPDNSLVAQVLNRSHSQLKLLKFDIKTGKRDVIFVEENATWINLHDCFTPIQKVHEKFAGAFIWASEKSGFRHLYLYDRNGVCLTPLTQGEWMVEEVAGVDESSNLVYFTGTLDSPLEIHLYCTKLVPDPGKILAKPRRLTNGEGRHVVVLDHKMKRFVDMHDSLNLPPRVLLCSLEDGKVLLSIYEQPAPTSRTRKLQLSAPETVQLTASDGLILYGSIYKPDAKHFGPPPYRTLVSVYGGPNVQTVCNTWMNTVDMRAQYLRSKGILVWRVNFSPLICMPILWSCKIFF
ncbi:hypothetical protein KP509_27G042600 [Ceratopteris richardii]|uniref:Dipeptidylpeptidase IV N-terminal domain-containing protein n=1 Tax=Ceratopteris richardii TaxID=49495 RepID=A0A8T2RIF8_CERRI|nr:hypothetical protein KP509_27G042600 [Ceratopteris richardii]